MIKVSSEVPEGSMNIYLPAEPTIAGNQNLLLWIASDGSTFYAFDKDGDHTTQAIDPDWSDFTPQPTPTTWSLPTQDPGCPIMTLTPFPTPTRVYTPGEPWINRNADYAVHWADYYDPGSGLSSIGPRR